jgi:omega-6 fatty acid desaturase (delta-12 desaturase)
MDSVSPPAQKPQVSIAEWKEIVAEYAQPSVSRATWQVINTLGPYALCWTLIYFALPVSYWLVLPLVILAGLLLVRVFIIFHDCGHGSFLKSRLGNDIIGFICGMLTFTPYYHWRWEHGIHHQTSGDLDRRGTGDVWTLTVQEYIEASRWKRFAYKLARNPVVLFVIAPVLLFCVRERFPNVKASARERQSVWWMNLALLCMIVVMSLIFGWKAYLLIQLSMMAVAGGAGVWMFYVQHQFEDVYWDRREDWDYTTAALQGSSFYKLPKILQWFSGNIGFHHIHHLSPKVPNYNLERCHNSHPLFTSVKPITLLSSLKSIPLRLWDENQRKLVGYRHMRKIRKQQREAAAHRDSSGPSGALGSK